VKLSTHKQPDAQAIFKGGLEAHTQALATLYRATLNAKYSIDPEQIRQQVEQRGKNASGVR